MRTIGIITTSRADFGIFVPIIKEINKRKDLKLKLFVIGPHVPSEYRAFIAAKVFLPKGDGPGDIAAAMGKVTQSFAKIFKAHQPDIILVLGDRYEMHAAALAAVPFNIPLAHIHGGELTEGSFDEYFRHSLTKLSHLHFASTGEYAKRIIQMGEEPWRVKKVGAPGLDNIAAMPIQSKEELARRFGIDFTRPILLVTFHPVTLEYQHTKKYAEQLLRALDAFKDCRIVFTAPNLDTYGNIILRQMRRFVSSKANSVLIENFGTAAYLSMMRYAQVMAGNSSSGIIEAPSFQLPVVNIGTRQQGRVKAKNVIDCGYSWAEIEKALRLARQPVFRAQLKGLRNPYGRGNAVAGIVKALSGVDLARLKSKKFYDLRKI